MSPEVPTPSIIASPPSGAFTPVAEPVSASVPARPVLAAGVSLAGPMEGSAFRDRQWLVRRDGRFIQISELLYRVLECADGQHTLAEIAEAVTAGTDWTLTADEVAALLERKLIPLRLVSDRVDGETPASPASRGHAPRSPLMVQLRMVVFGPQAIDAAARRLQRLYAPPVLGTLLLLVLLAQGWLYFVHGLSASLNELVLQPSLFLLVVGIIWAAAAFHELGHAAALRYSGGRSRAMGAGVYLIYPAFFTDTTDAYALSRAARIRTDLGGIYFHLLFTLALLAVYAVSRQEFLLLTVGLIDLEVLRQLIPVVRLDGYWLLADLTGVPDLFAQMKPFLRSLLPEGPWKGTAPPSLKRWSRVVFLAYVVVTVPILAYAGVRLAMSLPAIAAMLRAAFLVQLLGIEASYASGSAVGVAAFSLQMLVLLLPTLGLLAMVYAIVWFPLRLAWSWAGRARR